MTIVAASASLIREVAAAAGPGLLLHKFVKADSWRGALTADISGANLPLHGSAWIYSKAVSLASGDRRVGATHGQIADALDRQGYFLFPIADDI